MNYDDSSRTLASTGKKVTFVSEKFRKNYEIPGMAYQTNGIVSTMLWPTARSAIRIIPGYDPETKEIFRQNKDCTKYTSTAEPYRYISDSVCELRTMVKFGGQHNLIVSYRPGSPEHARWGGNTVLSWFSADINRAVRNSKDGKSTKLVADPEWTGWVSYNPETHRMPILPYDRKTLLMQALVWEMNGSYMKGMDKAPLVDDEGNPMPCLYLLGLDNSNAMAELYKAFVEPQDPSLPLDGKTNNKYKGILEQDGSMLYLLPTKRAVKDKLQNSLMPHVSDDEAVWVNTPVPLTDEDVYALWHPWDEILNYLTPEEQLQIIADTFPDGAHLVNYWKANNGTLKDLEVPETIARAGFGKYAKYMGGKVDLGYSSAPAPAMPRSFAAPRVSASRMPAFSVPALEKQAPVGETVPASEVEAAKPAMPKTARPSFKVPAKTVLTKQDQNVMGKLAGAGASMPDDPLSSLASDLVSEGGDDPFDSDAFPGIN